MGENGLERRLEMCALYSKAIIAILTLFRYYSRSYRRGSKLHGGQSIPEHEYSLLHAFGHVSYQLVPISYLSLFRWAIPVCMFFTWVYFRSKFHWSQYLGIFICILGMGLLVYSDQTHNFPDGPGKSMIKGDLLMLAGATLYGFSKWNAGSCMGTETLGLSKCNRGVFRA